jgi:hypothetical protein
MKQLTNAELIEEFTRVLGNASGATGSLTY